MTLIDATPQTPSADARPLGAQPTDGNRLRRLFRPPDAPPWYRPASAALIVATLAAYLWSLGASGWANAYYSAAVQAGTQSWKAMFFGSFDAANAITVDKTPASLWVMELSTRLFGVNSWSILVPEALMGVVTVALVGALVRRWFEPGAALLAGAVVACTPVAALMFRFDNPDALLVLLLTASAYAVTRAIEDGRTRWLVAAGSLVGFGFLTKMMQAFVVVPALAGAYLLAGPPHLWRRVKQLAAMAVTLIVANGWWVAIVELWPKGSRPYIGGSQHDSVLELMFGYNGLGRLTGNETGSVGGGAGTGRWGQTGLLRLFDADYGGQISWLLPAAVVVTVAGLVVTWRKARTDRTRAAVALWGGTLLLTGGVISLSEGIIHTYYTVALAPAIGVLVGIGAGLAWAHRHDWRIRALSAATVAGTAAWSAVLLGRTADWHPWLRPVVLVAGGLAALLLVIGGRPRLVMAGASLALVAALAGPVAYTANTIITPHTGSLPTAGPSTGRGFGPGNGVRGDGPGGTPPAGTARPTGGPTGAAPPGAAPPGAAATGAAAIDGTGGAMGPNGGVGGLLNVSTPSAAVLAALAQDADAYTWVAAAVGANTAAGYQLASGEPVLAIGGFNGSDPAPTLAEFKALVAEGRIHWFVAGGGAGVQNGGSNVSSEIASWVTGTFTATTVGSTTLYDLTAPTTA